MAAETYQVGDTYEFSTIQAAVDDIEGDLGAKGGVQTVEVYAKAGQYTETVDANAGFSNATENVDHLYIRAMVDHGGIGGNGIIVTSDDASTLVFHLYAHTWLEGFEITGDVVNFGFYGVAAFLGARVFNNIVRDSNNTLAGVDSRGIVMRDTGANDGYVYNNIVYNLVHSNNNAVAGIALADVGTGTMYCYNNTVYGIKGAATSVTRGIRASQDSAALVIKNNYAHVDPTGGNPNAFVFAGANVDNEHNVSADATATGPNSQINKAPGNQFVNAGVDFHLEKGADCIGTGIAAGQLSADDIVGTAWRDPPSAGAFEFVAVGVHGVFKPGVFDSPVFGGVL